MLLAVWSPDPSTADRPSNVKLPGKVVSRYLMGLVRSLDIHHRMSDPPKNTRVSGSCDRDAR